MMGAISTPENVKLFFSVIYSDEDIFLESKKVLKSIFGDIEDKCLEMKFDFTDYYDAEMGGNLYRNMIFGRELKTPEGLYKAKIRTNLIEDSLMVNGKRRVNIDPGYMDSGKIVLFTTKDYTHRVYAGEGIYGESTLFFKNGTYNAWPWTYPDYASAEMIKFFNEAREKYRGQIMNMAKDRSKGKGYGVLY